MTDPVLTSQALDELARGCLFRAFVPRDEAVTVHGITSTFGFDPARLQTNAPSIRALLAELPDEFWQARGGGWSFLNACNDRHGRHAVTKTQEP